MALAVPDAAEKEAPAKESTEGSKKPALELPKDDTHEKVMGDAIKAMGQMADIMVGVKDEATAKAAAEKILKLEPQLKFLGARAQKLGDPNPALEKELEAKYKPKMEEIQGKMLKAMIGLAENPEAAKHIQGAMEKIGEAMASF